MNKSIGALGAFIEQTEALYSFIKFALDFVAVKPELRARLTDIASGLEGELDFLGDYLRGKSCGKWVENRLTYACGDGCYHDTQCFEVATAIAGLANA